MNANEIKDAIIAKARDKRLTQKQLANMTGIEQANISRYFSSTPVTVPTTAFRLVDALGLELIVQPKNLPILKTPPSEYGDQPNDPDAGVFEQEPEPPEGLDEPEEPDEGAEP